MKLTPKPGIQLVYQPTQHQNAKVSCLLQIMPVMPVIPNPSFLPLNDSFALHLISYCGVNFPNVSFPEKKQKKKLQKISFIDPKT